MKINIKDVKGLREVSEDIFEKRMNELLKSAIDAVYSFSLQYVMSNDITDPDTTKYVEHLLESDFKYVSHRSILSNLQASSEMLGTNLDMVRSYYQNKNEEGITDKFKLYLNEDNLPVMVTVDDVKEIEKQEQKEDAYSHLYG